MKKPRKQTTLKEEAGRMLLDTGRIVLAGIVIVEILRGQIKGIDEELLHGILFIVGCAVVILCYMFGLFMVKREIKSDKSPSHRNGGFKCSLTSTPIHKRWRRKRGKR